MDGIMLRDKTRESRIRKQRLKEPSCLLKTINGLWQDILCVDIITAGQPE